MSDCVDTVRRQIDTGAVSGETLVLLFRAVEEAAQRHDIGELNESLELARRIARAVGDPLRPEAERLVALCEERLALAAPAARAASRDEIACPGCGRPVAASAVRCRACGTLLV